jgi:hypothetical protein
LPFSSIGGAQRLYYPVGNEGEIAIGVGFPDPVGCRTGDIQKTAFLLLQPDFRIDLPGGVDEAAANRNKLPILIKNGEMAGQEIFRLLVGAKGELSCFSFPGFGNAADNFEVILRQGREDFVFHPEGRSGAEMIAISAVGINNAAVGAGHIHRRGLFKNGIKKFPADDPLNRRKFRAACLFQIRMKRNHASLPPFRHSFIPCAAACSPY